jgi:hypothetical protein
MIVVKLMGGLGNQMFQYATARRLAHKHGVPLRLDVSDYKNMHENDTPRHFSLDAYKISGKVANENELASMLSRDFRATLPYKISRRLGIDKRLRPLGESAKGLNSIVLRARNNTYLVGWWQNEGYFQDIKDILLKEFVPKKNSSYSRSILEQMGVRDAVAIHVRRGDYVTNKHANKEHGLTPLDYYKAAMKIIEESVKAPRYYVFSDDIDWCKKNLPLGKDAVFVDKNGEARPHEDIYLMQNCKHNIIANSSFSWWGAWLNNNPDKIVIAPKVWFQNKATDADTEIVPPSWMRL